MERRTITLTESESGRVLHVDRGDRVVLRLHEMPGAGYIWSLEGSEPPQVEVRLVPPPDAGASVGGAVDVEWVITAKAAGMTRVIFKLGRSWEGEASVKSRFEVTLEIAE